MNRIANGTSAPAESVGGTARLTVALVLTGLLVAALAAVGGARYADDAGAQVIPPGQSQYTKPGWGCGDKNHIHTGPPGRPNATPPPGCAQAQAAKAEAKARCTAKQSKANAKANANAKKAKATKRKCGKATAAKAKRRP